MKTFTGTVVALTALAAKVNAFYGTAHMLGKSIDYGSELVDLRPL